MCAISGLHHMNAVQGAQNGYLLGAVVIYRYNFAQIFIYTLYLKGSIFHPLF